MEILFECVFDAGKGEKNIREIFRKQSLSPLIIFCDIIWAAIAVYGIVTAVRNAKVLYFDILPYLYIAVFVVIIGFQIYKYFKSISVWKKRRDELGQNSSSKISVSRDKLYIYRNPDDEEPTEVSFDNMKKVILSKNLILIRSAGNMLYIFPKDSFTVGTPESFLEFLKEKGLKIRKFYS